MKLYEFGLWLKDERERQKIRQTDLADMIGMSNITICNIECGKHGTKIETIERIANILGYEAHLTLKRKKKWNR